MFHSPWPEHICYIDVLKCHARPHKSVQLLCTFVSITNKKNDANSFYKVCASRHWSSTWRSSRTLLMICYKHSPSLCLQNLWWPESTWVCRLCLWKAFPSDTTLWEGVVSWTMQPASPPKCWGAPSAPMLGWVWRSLVLPQTEDMQPEHWSDKSLDCIPFLPSVWRCHSFEVRRDLFVSPFSAFFFSLFSNIYLPSLLPIESFNGSWFVLPKFIFAQTGR